MANDIHSDLLAAVVLYFGNWSHHRTPSWRNYHRLPKEMKERFTNVKAADLWPRSEYLQGVLPVREAVA